MKLLRKRPAAGAAGWRPLGWQPLLIGALWLLGSAGAQAHKPSDAYLTLQLDGTQVEQRLDISLRDLDRELLLDTNDDGALSWREVQTRWTDIEELAQAAVVVRRGERACTLEPAVHPRQLQAHSDGTYAVLRASWRCSGTGAVNVDYRLFAATDPTHRAVVRVLDGGVQLASAVLVPGAPPRALAAPLQADRVPASGGIRLWDFFAEGVHHILAGTDHALFLLALLLPAVLQRRAPARLPRRAPLAAPRKTAPVKAALGWYPAPTLRPALGTVAGIVTAFTLAHSITLALSALELIRVPSRWVESAIALSIIFAALNNLFPTVVRRLWLLTFVFGLVHGIGFAGVLADVGLQGRAMVPPLLAFNLGVELGQLLIVGAWLLLAWPLRRHAAYLHLLRWGSAAVALLASVWLAERLLLIEILGM